METKKLFGTDGVRGRANIFPMTAEIALRLAQALAKVFKQKKMVLNGKRCKVIIGKDTRISSYVFEAALTSGFCSMGVDVYLVGPLPTPAIAHLTKSFGAEAGIMITASHNPFEDNGIKFFFSDGYKISDEIELEIENLVLNNKLSTEQVAVQDMGKAYRVMHAIGRYIEFVKNTIHISELTKLKVILDCANGASYGVAPIIFNELGLEVITYGDKPDGLNINKNCGAVHPEFLQKKVIEHNADVGIAFDGDADRVIIVDEKGNIIDGDHILAICAETMIREGTLKQNTVVATVYSNIALDQYINSIGGKVVRTKNGDRYVLEEMRGNNYNLGGEFSGHIIFGDYNTSGDGIVSALKLLEVVSKTGKKLSELGSCFEKYPQIIVNVPVKEKKPIERLSSVENIIKKYEEQLGSRGRILVRYSGTEMLCRVMVEGEEKQKISNIANKIAQKIKEEVGV